MPADQRRIQPPTADDLASFPAFRAWFTRVRGITYPEAELRQTSVPTPDGGVSCKARFAAPRQFSDPRGRAKVH